MRILPRVKRFREQWLADPGVRDNPEAAAGALGLDVESLAGLWRPDAGGDTAEARALRQIESCTARLLAFADDDGGALEAYRQWRERQKARALFALGNVLASGHAPFCVELTRGCSLGCWFCGLSAGRLEKVLPTDLKLWRKMLEALYGLFGASGARGFLYWATDPLDHPDYELFSGVFRNVFGRFPATTTAAAHVDPDRTRKLIAAARAGHCPALRFSVVSLRRMTWLHSEFSVEELADVELLPVNRASALGLAEAGRMRDKADRRWASRLAGEKRKLREWEKGDLSNHTTIACVSGFLVEPVDGRIRLISPEPSSDRSPDGYAVFDEVRYDTADSFRRGLDTLVERHMGPEPPPALALQRGVEVRSLSAHAVTASARRHEVTFTASVRKIDHLPTLAMAFRDAAPVRETANAVARRFGLQPGTVRRDVADLWRRGVLIEPVFDLAGAPPAALKASA